MIVVVDDDVLLLRSIELIFSDQGYSVRTFCCAGAAMSYFDNGGDADFLLLDYFIPESNGISLLENIRNHLSSECVVVLMSGAPDCIDKQDIRDACVDDFLCKPVSLDLLLRLIEAS